MKITKIFGVIFLLAILAFVGTCSYQMFKGNKQGSSPEPPTALNAQYSLRIKNTGTTIYTNNMVKLPVNATQYSYTMPYGYWEANKDKFIFKKARITLDERMFGEIEVKKR